MTTTADDVWRILAELAEAQKETERRIQDIERLLYQQTEATLQSRLEMERIIKEESQKTERHFRETDRRMQETDRRMQETDRRMQETDRNIKAVNQQISSLGGKWGRFVENMVAPACETLFLSRGIPIHQVSQRVKKRRDHRTLEIDILVTNNDHVLVVEVKSSLGMEHVRELIEDLREFREFFPEYQDKRLYGAVAGIDIEEGVDKYAYRQGLFVLVQTGETVSILNDEQFQPRDW